MRFQSQFQPTRLRRDRGLVAVSLLVLGVAAAVLTVVLVF